MPKLRSLSLCRRFGVANTQLRLEDGSPYYIPNSELSKCAAPPAIPDRGTSFLRPRKNTRAPRAHTQFADTDISLNPPARRNAIRNLSASRLSHRRIQASFRVPYDALPLVRELTRRMEAYLRSRKDVDDIPDRHPTRVVLGDVDEYSLVLSVQAFVPAPGMPLVEFDRIKSEVLLDLGARRRQAPTRARAAALQLASRVSWPSEQSLDASSAPCFPRGSSPLITRRHHLVDGCCPGVPDEKSFASGAAAGFPGCGLCNRFRSWKRAGSVRRGAGTAAGGRCRKQ